MNAIALAGTLLITGPVATAVALAQQEERHATEQMQRRADSQRTVDRNSVPDTPPASTDPHAHHPSPSGEGTSGEPAEHDDTSAPTASEREHVPPDPPTHEMREMSYRAMAEMMSMDDNALFGTVLVDQLDWRDTDAGNALSWNAQAWYGSDYHKLWFKTEGERLQGTTEQARAELLWDRIFSRWWSLQVGVRHDIGKGPSRNWLAVGVAGLAPYFFELETTAYLGEDGGTAARVSAEYDLLLTQRLIVQPELEFSLYGKSDPDNGIGSGLSDAHIALRLRYEARREIAPYVGLIWVRHFGNTADLLRASDEDTHDLQVLAGIRFWF